MTKASDNEFPSVLFDEQAGDVSTPASGFWRAYFKSDGLYVIDDAATVTGPLGEAGSASGGLIAVTQAVRTSGDITISNTGSFGNVDTGIDLVFAAQTGDIIELGANALLKSSSQQLIVTASTIVSGSVVNNLASGTSTEKPIHNWSKYNNAPSSGIMAGGVIYTLQSGDISGGNVTIRLRALVGSGTSDFHATSGNPLIWWAKQYRP